MELTKNEAFAIAEFIEMFLFDAIRLDTDWDNLYNLQSLIHGYEKCCEVGGYGGITDRKEEKKGWV